MPLLMVYLNQLPVTRVNQHRDPKKDDGAEILHLDGIEEVIPTLTSVPDGDVLPFIHRLKAGASSTHLSDRRTAILFITTSFGYIEVFIRTTIGVIVIALAGRQRNEQGSQQYR